MIRAANSGWPVLFANLHAADVQTTVQVYWDTLAKAADLADDVLADCRRWTGFLKRIYVAETDAEAERDVRGPIERLVDRNGAGRRGRGASPSRIGLAWLAPPTRSCRTA